MISQTAIDAIKDLEAEGLRLPPQDVINLNARGLRLEAARGRDISRASYLLPRVAVVSERISFRQPTVGHDIWLAKVRRFMRDGDFETKLAVYCFALSRPCKELPDPDAPDVIKRCVEPFIDEIADRTIDQLYAAMRYVMHGIDETSCDDLRRNVADDDDTHDWNTCVSVGMLNEGVVFLRGVTVAEIMDMTEEQLTVNIRNAYKIAGLKFDGEAERLEGEFFAAVDEIRNRLRG